MAQGMGRPPVDPLDHRIDALQRRLGKTAVAEIEDVAGAVGGAAEDFIDLPFDFRERGEKNDRIELFGPESKWNQHFDERPVAGILVDDVPAFRQVMEAAGIEFVHTGSDGGVDWAHFRAPDGNLYEICHDHRRPR